MKIRLVLHWPFHAEKWKFYNGFKFKESTTYHMLAEWPLKTKHKSSLFKTNQRSRAKIEEIFCTGVTEFSHWGIVFWGKKHKPFLIWFQNCRFYIFLRLFPHFAQIPTGKSFVLNYILTNSGSCNELGKPLRLERSPVDFLFFRSRSHVFSITWSLFSLFRDPSPANSVPIGSQTHNIWTIFIAFHHILITETCEGCIGKDPLKYRYSNYPFILLNALEKDQQSD